MPETTQVLEMIHRTGMAMLQRWVPHYTKVVGSLPEQRIECGYSSTTEPYHLGGLRVNQHLRQASVDGFFTPTKWYSGSTQVRTPCLLTPTTGQAGSSVSRSRTTPTHVRCPKSSASPLQQSWKKKTIAAGTRWPPIRASSLEDQTLSREQTAFPAC